METQNEQLAGILKLIQESFESKNINNEDLNEIIFFTSGLIRVGQSAILQINKNLNYQWKLEYPEEIPPKEAVEAKEQYVAKFGNNPLLANKVFRFDSKLIIDLLNSKKDLLVYFSLDLSGQLCIILKSTLKKYEISNSLSREMIGNESKIQTDLFKNKLKSEIESKLKNTYTEYITIPFRSNFDHFNGHYPQTIVLVPAISIKKHAGRMTLVMNFEGFDGITSKGKDSDYDTFTPHP